MHSLREKSLHQMETDVRERERDLEQRQGNFDAWMKEQEQIIQQRYNVHVYMYMYMQVGTCTCTLSVHAITFGHRTITDQYTHVTDHVRLWSVKMSERDNARIINYIAYWPAVRAQIIWARASSNIIHT